MSEENEVYIDNIEVEKAPFTKNQARSFVNDIIEVYKKHNLSLSHEDSHGGFLVEELSEHNVEWLKQCMACCKYYSDGERSWFIYRDAEDVDDLKGGKS